MPREKMECALDAAILSAVDENEIKHLLDEETTIVFSGSQLYCGTVKAHACASWPAGISLNSRDPDAIRALMHELAHVRCWGRAAHDNQCWTNGSPALEYYEATERGRYAAQLVGCGL